uniref:Uncharacterized protein n=1 Tax=Meloidogyne enterolobii TaxID=390850 RepID=A0A6V7YA60_MELEN|nr:unnamed protein product [Meloidogyne enterolobii]
MKYWKVWNYSIFLCILFLLIVHLVDSVIEKGEEGEDVKGKMNLVDSVNKKELEKGETSNAINEEIPKTVEKKKKVTFNLSKQIKVIIPKSMTEEYIKVLNEASNIKKADYFTEIFSKFYLILLQQNSLINDFSRCKEINEDILNI